MIFDPKPETEKKEIRKEKNELYQTKLLTTLLKITPLYRLGEKPTVIGMIVTTVISQSVICTNSSSAHMSHRYLVTEQLTK